MCRFFIGSIQLAVLITLCTFHAQSWATQPLYLGQRVVTIERLTVADGRGGSVALTPGTIATCSSIKADKVWLSGPAAGWVDRSAVESVHDACERYAQLVRDEKSEDWRRNTAVYCQLLVASGQATLATGSIRTLHSVDSDPPFIQCVAFLVDLVNSENRETSISFDRLLASSELSANDVSVVFAPLVGRGRSRDASRLLDKVIENGHILPNDLLVFMTDPQWTARVRTAEGDDTEPELLIDAICESDRYFALPRRYMAAAFKRSGRPDLAIQHLEKFLVSAPDCPSVCVDLGSLRMGIGDRTKAIHYYRKAVSAAPEFASAHVWLGIALLATSDAETKSQEEAIQHLQTANAIKGHRNPAYARAYCMALLQTGAKSRCADALKMHIESLTDAERNLDSTQSLLREFAELGVRPSDEQ